MLIFNGKKEAAKILWDLKKRIQKTKVKPKLAVISVGKDPASELFVRNKKRAAKEIGIKVIHYKFKNSTKGKRVIEKIRDLNKSPSFNGIIVQLPLPKKLKTDKIIAEIRPQKDIDGFGKKTYFQPPLISAILIALKSSKKNLKNRKISALVNSDIFGKTLKKSLSKEGFKINYLKNRKSPKIKTADILITVLGVPKLIKGTMIKKGVILVDAGITLIKKNKIVGDIDKESVKNKAAFLTPVPGGIGPLTIAYLLKNVYSAVKYHE